MKFRKIIFISLIATQIAGMAGCAAHSDHAATGGNTAKSVENKDPHKDHAAQPDLKAKPRKPVPAYQGESSLASLGPTLSPDLYKGQTRAAYAAVREIPKTIAQLPCFCRCDKSIGHKSLYSCFEDDHAAACGICMNSALKALKLQKEQKMTPDQIRAELIKEYDGY